MLDSPLNICLCSKQSPGSKAQTLLAELENIHEGLNAFTAEKMCVSSSQT